MTSLIMAAFEDTKDADAALLHLESLGYTSQDISVISAENNLKSADKSKKGANASAVGAGAIIGGLAGLIATISVVPAIAGIIIGGPVIALMGLSGVVTGAVTGGLIGALTKMGLSKDTAKSYHEIIDRGGVVLGVGLRQDVEAETREALESNRAKDISTVENSTSTKEDSPAREQLGNTSVGRRPVFGEKQDLDQDKE